MKSNFWLIVSLLVLLSSCSANRSSSGIDPNRNFFTPRNWQIPISKETKAETTQVESKEIAPAAIDDQMTGLASLYGPEIQGKKTANGELYDPEGLTAAHMLLPMNTWVQVINPENKRSVVVRINDRGPSKDGHIINLTQKGGEVLGLKETEAIKVRLEIVKKAQEKKEIAETTPEPEKEIAVQIAVFSTRDRANGYVTELSQKYSHLPFLIEEQSKRYHVLVGPYAEKSEAVLISRQLKSDGVDNFVRRLKK